MNDAEKSADDSDKIVNSSDFTVVWTNPEGEEEHGPLAVLWSLIESYSVDIFDVSLLQITNDYMDFMNRSQELRIEHVSTFAVMASRLLFYKSKALLPDPGFEDADDDPRLPPELIRQLLEYRKFQMAAEKMRDIEVISSGMLSRKSGLALKDTDEGDGVWLDVSMAELVRSYADLLKRKSELDPGEDQDSLEITMDEFSVEEKIDAVRKLLEDAVSFSFTDLFEDIHKMNREEIITIFLALLELSKLGTIILRQKGIFGPIEIFRHNAIVH